MRIQHNILAMNSYRNYSNNTSALGKNLEKLSSGYKINRAGDDAAGLAISEKMRAQIQGLSAAQKNVKDAISFVKTAEGAMQEIQDMLSRMKYLATQSANGTYQDDVDREALQDEVNSLLEEIDRIASAANFNDIHMLAGGGGGDDDTTTDSVTPPTATGVGTAGLTGEGDVTVSFDDDATEEQMQALLKALTEGNGLTITATDSDGNTTPESFKIEGLPAGYTFKYMDAQTTSTEASYTDGGTLTVGTAPGNVSLTTPLVLDIYDDDGKVGSITIDTSKLLAIASGSTAVTTVTFEAADDVSKLARAEGTGDGDGDGKILKGTTIEYSFDGFTSQPSATQTFKIGEKEYTFVANGSSPSAGEIEIGNDIDETLDNIAKAIAADKIFEAEYDKASSTLKLTTTVDYDDQDALDAATAITDGSGTAWAGVAHMQNSDNVTVTPFDDGDNDDTGAGGGFYTIKMQIGDSSKGYDSMEIKIQSMSTGSIGVAGLDISNIDSAHEAIDTVKEAINTVSSVRGKLGAYQNRLEHTANNLSVMTENIQDAESTIRDTDVADEMMGYVKNNILVQSAQAMLAQANQVPQGVLQLLG